MLAAVEVGLVLSNVIGCVVSDPTCNSNVPSVWAVPVAIGVLVPPGV